MSEITYLTTSFQEKEQVKCLGAKWDGVAKKWYVPAGVDLAPFKIWLPNTDELLAEPLVVSAEISNQHDSIGLAALLSEVANIIVSALPANVWIKAEISQVRRVGEHLAIELVEHDKAGLLIARAQAFLWKSNLDRLLAKFKNTTGFDFNTGIKAMLSVKTEFNATHGIRLIIQDIDPSYTLGDIEAKLKNIRDTLTKEAIITRNKQLPIPQEFCCVAVISPEGAAGLGDFKRDADKLEQVGLCDFDYFFAKFQGTTAAVAIKNALVNVQLHADKYDALCIIRGGGSVTDLYWLNDLELARAVCLSALAVFTGIGHERDHTILDEVANSRFDTPSKVIAHIREVICSNTHTAAANYQQILFNAQQQLAWAEQLNETLLLQVKNDGLRAIKQAEYASDQLANGLQASIQYLLAETDTQLQQTLHFIDSKTTALLVNVEAYIEHLQDRIMIDAHHWLISADANTEQAYQAVFQYGQQQLQQAAYQLEALGKEIIGISPYATLNRGFAIVRDASNSPVVSAAQARQQAFLTIEFRDGIVTAKPTQQTDG
jgi:exodeoxyribonuclease VII large subunit